MTKGSGKTAGSAVPVTFKIPVEHVPGFQSLAELTDEEFDTLTKVLSEAQAKVEPMVYVRDVLSRLSATEIDSERVLNILKMLLGMYRSLYRSELEQGQFVAAVMRSLEGKLATEKDQNTLTPRINALLSKQSSLVITAKAIDVLTEQAKSLVDARVVCDLRPIFFSNSDEPAFHVMHNLSLRYFEDDTTRTLIVGLDSSDLKRLKDVVERALDKEAALHALLDRRGLTALSVTSEEE